MPISKVAPNEVSTDRNTHQLSALLSLDWVIVTLFAQSIILKHCISLEQQSGVDNGLIVSFVRLSVVNTSEICLLLFLFTFNNEASFVLCSCEEDYSAKWLGSIGIVEKHRLKAFHRWSHCREQWKCKWHCKSIKWLLFLRYFSRLTLR